MTVSRSTGSAARPVVLRGKAHGQHARVLRSKHTLGTQCAGARHSCGTCLLRSSLCARRCAGAAISRTQQREGARARLAARSGRHMPHVHRCTSGPAARCTGAPPAHVVPFLFPAHTGHAWAAFWQRAGIQGIQGTARCATLYRVYSRVYRGYTAGIQGVYSAIH